MNSGTEFRERSSQSEMSKRSFCEVPDAEIVMDKDDMNKADMEKCDGENDCECAEGEGVVLRKSFSLWSLLGVGFGLTNSWFGISASMATGLASGGPVILVYGIILIALISITIAVSLGELTSAYPHAGGQFWWSLKLARPEHKRFAAYMCGCFAYAGSVFTSASTTLSVSSELVAMYALTHESFKPKRWQVFVTYLILHSILLLFNCYGKPLPLIASSSLYISLVSFITITITVLACSSGHFNTAKFVFANFDNQTGWANNGIAFLIGLMNPAWSFSCLDCATHMAFEVEQPERVLPIAILGTVGIGFITSFCYVISICFCIRNIKDVINSTSGFPILEIYYQATSSKAGAIVLGCLILVTSFGCVISCHTWQSRLCWSFSRDGGLPLSKFWSKVNTRLGVPLNAHLMSCCWVYVIGFLYLASSAAFNALITACISFLLLSYSIPVICLLMRKRKIPHGPFWYNKFGLFCNICLLLWTVFCLVFFSFPPNQPVNRNNMNYVCVVIVGYFLYCVLFWAFCAKKVFGLGYTDEDENAEEPSPQVDDGEDDDAHSYSVIVETSPEDVGYKEKPPKLDDTHFTQTDIEYYPEKSL